SNPDVIRLGAAGRITAGKPGRATLTATAGRASAILQLTVVENPVSSLRVAPGDTAVRTGDVVPLQFAALAGRSVLRGARPEWSVAGGAAVVDDDGYFVAYEPGDYRVVASFAGRSAESVIAVRQRD